MGLGRESWCENSVDSSGERSWEGGRSGGRGFWGGGGMTGDDAGGGAVVLSNGLRLSARGGEGVGGGMGVEGGGIRGDGGRGGGIRGKGRWGDEIKSDTHHTNLLSLTCRILRQPEYLYAKVIYMFK